MTLDKNGAKLMAVEIMGEDYREVPESKFKFFWRIIKKCLPGY